MKKITKKMAAWISIPVGAILAVFSSCGSHKDKIDVPACVYGPPSMFEKKMDQPKPVVYGPRPVFKEKKQVPDTTATVQE